MLEPSVNTLRIKRKRDEQGPHALVIDQRSPKKQQQTYHGAIFRRVDPEDTSFHRSYASHRTASAQVLPTIPVVRVTQPGEENRPIRTPIDSSGSIQPALEAATQLRQSVHSPLLTPSRADHSTLRRFHLSRRSLPASQSLPGVDKKRKGDSVIPVFIESKKAVLTGTHVLDDTSRPHEDHGIADSKPKDLTSSPRKRPGAGAAERQWRANTWSAPESKKSLSSVQQPPQDLVRDLEKFAEDIDYEDSKAVSDPAKNSRSRYAPKAPALRYKDRHPEEFATKDHDAMDIDMEDDSEYVYDTYVRDVTMTEPPTDHGAFGLLVIADEDQELWETFGDNDESDDHFDTDDEDENAEDYYGADYPEDEVDSDDEIGVDSYKYRQGASDDEEYDAEDGAWSDDEGAHPVKPWTDKLQLK